MTWIWAVLILFVTWAAIAITILLVRNRKLTKLRRALNDGNERQAISLAWAWADHSRILAAQRYWGEHVFADILEFPAPSIVRMVYPLPLLTIVSVLIYQSIYGASGYGPLGRCKSTPNCSNYFVGCITRYGFITAIAMTHIRVRNCVGGSQPTFRPDYQ